MKADRDAERAWSLITEQAAPAPHLAYPEGRAALRTVLVTVPRVSRSCEKKNGWIRSPPPTMWGLELRVEGTGCGGSGFRVQGSGFRIQGSEFRV